MLKEKQLVIDLRSSPACLGQMKLRRMKVFLLLKEVSAAYKNSVLDSGDQFLCSTLWTTFLSHKICLSPAILRNSRTMLFWVKLIFNSQYWKFILLHQTLCAEEIFPIPMHEGICSQWSSDWVDRKASPPSCVPFWRGNEWKSAQRRCTQQWPPPGDWVDGSWQGEAEWKSSNLQGSVVYNIKHKLPLNSIKTKIQRRA